MHVHSVKYLTSKMTSLKRAIETIYPQKLPIINQNQLPFQRNSKDKFDSPFLYNRSFQPQFKLKGEPIAFEEQEQIAEIPIQNDKFLSSSLNVKKNCIDHRIQPLQQQANSPCEDTIIYDQLKQLDAYAVSIFDGHGGPELAQYSKHNINAFIDSYLKQNLNPNQQQSYQNIGQILKQSLIWSYQKLEDNYFKIFEQQLRQGNKKIKHVGTCGITAIVYNDTIYIGNSGDSQGILVKLTENNGLKSQKTNERLSVNNRAQRQRIIKQWKDIDNDVIIEEEGNSFYLKGRLQPTRTIGDYYLKKKEYFNGKGEFKGPYLKCTPQVNEFKLSSAHKYIVLASDGVWDVLSSNEVMDSMINGKDIDLNKTYYQEEDEGEIPDINNIVQQIQKKCCLAAGKTMAEMKSIPLGKRRNYHDDITIAVINLEGQL